MKRWVWFSLCGLLGLLLLLCGWLIPAHLRAIEEPVLAQASRNSASLTGRGVSLAHIQQYGSADMLLRAAQRENISDTNELVATLDAEFKKSAMLKLWGAPVPTVRPYFPKNPKATDTNFTDLSCARRIAPRRSICWANPNNRLCSRWFNRAPLRTHHLRPLEGARRRSVRCGGGHHGFAVGSK